MENLTTALVDRSTPQPDRIKILIVDDEVALLQLFEETLTNAGYQVIAEKNSANAVNLAFCMQPDIILLDVVMPNMDGFTVCDQLQQNHRTNSIPIIFLTINDQLDKKIRGLELGGVDYLIKPIKSGELLARIMRHIKISRLRQTLEQTINDKESQLHSLKSKYIETNQFITQSELTQQKMLAILEAGTIEINQHFSCISANNSAAYLLGYNNTEEMIGKQILTKEQTIGKRKTDLQLKNNSFIRMVNNVENSLLTKDNRQLPVRMDLTPAIDSVHGKIAIISFTDFRIDGLLKQEFTSPIYKDALTGLINKVGFYTILNNIDSQVDDQENKYAIFIIDLDYFKKINDSFGHLVGDQVLCVVAERLTRCVRSQDKVARLGGDEFGLLVGNIGDTEHLKLTATRLIKEIRQPIYLKNITITPSACIGIAIFDKPSNIEDIINRADIALYKSKSDRQKGYTLFQDEMMDELEDGIMLEKDLSNSIVGNQLFIEYQPQFSLSTSEYIGAEALVRWNHPNKGKLLPINFLPIAEKRGFLRNISNYSLMRVCEQIEKWKIIKANFGRISVNICAAQLNDSGFFEDVRLLLSKYRVEPNDLVLELTESTLLSINDEIRDRLLNFTKLGIKFAIDDFGKGYSSMQILKDMHSDIMKIDKDFVEEIETNDKTRVIIKAIIDLSKSLNMHVVAEGVENEAQLKFLRECGCDSFQGFYHRKSVDPNSLAEYFGN